MEVTPSQLIGGAGFFLAVIEIWRPHLSVKIEQTIDSYILEYSQFQKEYRGKLQELGKVAGSTFKEVAKGPKFDQDIEETTAEMLVSIENTKENLRFYQVTIINFLILRPLKNILLALNKIGRGHAVGGLGLALGLASIIL